ncbi:PIN domain-containing protein [Candidatus Albibeggiatoa sp. nov. NOAA]|uniref:type II toxin-antitoxin system VapC family toxin n=1 Tax=Candidatus Albibeggiatoa sp. nov. NOAA TaxID=3162724 RepID=UPI0032F1B5B3|nr:PIN domain-containing protein [Thiotrichaceae bacterium]
MTQAILDTGFLYALIDESDANHKSVRAFASTCHDDLILPIPVIPEICYLLYSRLGHKTMRHFLSSSLIESELASLLPADLKRCYELLEIYADSKLDFVDVSIVSIAERYHIRRILTVDRRDFSMIRPKHCDYFELLP